MRIDHHIGRILAGGLLTRGLTAAAAPRGTQLLAHTQLARRLAATVAAMLGLAVAILAASPAIAFTSRAVRQDAGGLPGMNASGPIHGQVPVGLRAAVRRTLSVHASRAAVTQQAELTASDGTGDNETDNDNFARWLAISGSTVVVGAAGGYIRPAAYVFTRSGTTWTEQAKLTAPDGTDGDQFGYSVAISKSTAIFGANGNNRFTGAVYIFTSV